MARHNAKGPHLGHALAAELELDDLDVPGRIDLDVVLALSKLGLERRAQSTHVVRLAVNEDEVCGHNLSKLRVSQVASQRGCGSSPRR